MTPSLFGGLPTATPARGPTPLVTAMEAEGAALPVDAIGAEFAVMLDAASTVYGAPVELDLAALDATGVQAVLPEGVIIDPNLPAAPTVMPSAMPSATPLTPEGSGTVPKPSLDAGGWPPPGLSALFPEPGTRFNPEGETLPPAPLGPRLPAAPLQGGAAPEPVPAPMTLATAPSTETMVRAPATLPVPERDAALAALDAGFDAAGDVAPDVAPARGPEGLAGLSATTASTFPRLELSQPFPQPVPLASPRFAEEVGVRLQWMAEQKGGDATLRIAPDGLGPVEIRLKLDGDRVDLGFAALQADTRQALEQALPKLREMLAQQGLHLGHADVGQQHAQHAKDSAPDGVQRSAGDDEGSALAAGAGEGAKPVSGVIRHGGRGVLDLYA